MQTLEPMWCDTHQEACALCTRNMTCEEYRWKWKEKSKAKERHTGKEQSEKHKSDEKQSSAHHGWHAYT